MKVKIESEIKGIWMVHEIDENQPSLLEKWAEEDLNSNFEFRTEDTIPMYEMIKFYEMTREGGFMHDE